jgi:cyclin L
MKITPPHKFLLVYMNVLNGDQDLAQVSWNYLNDSFRTNVCLKFKPEVIATACIYMASKRLGLNLPENPPWYELFDTTKEQCLEIYEKIEELYKFDKKISFKDFEPENCIRKQLSLLIEKK